MFTESDVIFSYTRKQAIEDGVLVDISETARQLGFRYAVAVTAHVWAEVIVPDDRAKSLGQSESGRLWDVLWMLHVAIKGAAGSPDTLLYKLIVSDGRKQREVQLKSVCGPGDEGEPVITIMGEHED